MREIKRRIWGLVSLVSFGVILGGLSMAHAQTAAPPPSGLDALEQPVAMPSFKLPSTNGGTLDSSALKGKVVLVRFWATW
jgi:cytochrome oxidase Cu insertion factor (SCO1/SenC/PrrC family)